MAGIQKVRSRDGTPIAYRASGTGDPIVLVHGGATSSADWLLVLPLLRERFTVVTMDRRGRGESGDAPGYAMEREAEDIVAVLDAVGAELLVGHSYGALCSILAAERTGRLRRLVLYEPPISRVAEIAGGVQEVRGADEAAALLERFLRRAGTSQDEFAAIRSSAAWPGLLDAVRTLPRELRACGAWRHPSGRIDVATLFLLGAETDSPVYLEGLDDLRAAFPRSRLETIAAQRHVAHVFAARRFADLVAGFCG